MKDALGAARASRLPGLDTLRALAILAVMFFHLRDRLPDTYRVFDRFGWMGVDLFFVLSGYLIGNQLLKPYVSGTKPSLLLFYWRRAFRILPVYLVVLALYVLWPAWREEPGLPHLWQLLTFTANLSNDYLTGLAFSHVWSLCVEEHFYLLFPALVFLLMRRSAAWKAGVVLAFFVGMGIALRAFFLFHELRVLTPPSSELAYFKHIYYPSYARLDGLLVGITLALLKTFRPIAWKRLSQHGHLTFATGLALLAVSIWFSTVRFYWDTRAGELYTLFGFPLLALAFGLLVTSAVSANGYLSRIAVPGAQAVAALAYSLYLTHKEVAHLDSLYLPHQTAVFGIAAALIYTTSCLLVAALLYYAVERPCLVLRERFAPTPVSLHQGASQPPAV